VARMKCLIAASHPRASTGNGEFGLGPFSGRRLAFPIPRSFPQFFSPHPSFLVCPKLHGCSCQSPRTAPNPQLCFNCALGHFLSLFLEIIFVFGVPLPGVPCLHVFPLLSRLERWFFFAAYLSAPPVLFFPQVDLVSTSNGHGDSFCFFFASVLSPLRSLLLGCSGSPTSCLSICRLLAILSYLFPF